MLQLEQWEWCLWLFKPWTKVHVEDSEASQVHDLRFPRSSKQRLPEEGCVRKHPDGTHETGRNKAKVETKTDQTEASASYSYTYETEDEEGEKGEDGDPDDEITLQAKTIEEFYQKRVFIFIHHCGPPGPPHDGHAE